MGSKAKDSNQIVIMAPLSGKIVALEQVPDPVFSEKALGDGIAILPEDGKIYSPVNGEIASVAATKHAYGFQSEDGVDVLVHVGLETVGLQGEGFTVHKQEGDKVKIGDLVAEADLEFIKNKGLNLVTPVLLCDGVDELQMEAAAGRVEAGKDAVLFLSAAGAEGSEAENGAVRGTAGSAAGSSAKGTSASAAGNSAKGTSGKGAPAQPAPKKKLINFDFLQKLGKVLMTVIAVMPAAGLMLSIGKLIQIAGGDISWILLVGSTMENIGWAIINNLHILFAAARGCSIYCQYGRQNG